VPGESRGSGGGRGDGGGAGGSRTRPVGGGRASR
jgi:hypothetical protein